MRKASYPEGGTSIRYLRGHYCNLCLGSLPLDHQTAYLGAERVSLEFVVSWIPSLDATTSTKISLEDLAHMLSPKYLNMFLLGRHDRQS
jgi:hypothetical protein